MKTRIILVTTLLGVVSSAGSLAAGVEEEDVNALRRRPERVGVVNANDGHLYSPRNYAPARDVDWFDGARTAEESLAEALVNTLVRTLTSDLRSRDAAPVNGRIVRQSKLGVVEIGYQATLADGVIVRETCETRFPETLTWRTVNGRWDGGGVSRVDLRRALRTLGDLGIGVDLVAYRLTSRRHRRQAAAMMRNLGLTGTVTVPLRRGGERCEVTLTRFRLSDDDALITVAAFGAATDRVQ